MSRPRSLAPLFAELNARYFGHRLPRYRVILRTAVDDEESLGLCNNRTRTILLRKDLSPEDLRLTLLHETCHIGTGPGHLHGPRFLRKVRRLVRLGESNLLEDVERYDGTKIKQYLAAQRAAGKAIKEVSFRSALDSDIEAAAIEWPRRRWSTVASLLAGRYDTTPAALRRVAPGAERQWRQAAADVRYHQRVAKAFDEGRMPPKPPVAR